MKFLAVVALTLGLAAAQSKPKCAEMAMKIPECPRKLIDAAAADPSIGCKGGVNDLVCMCPKMTQIQAKAAPKLESSCPGVGSKLGEILNLSKQICACQNGKKHKMI